MKMRMKMSSEFMAAIRLLRIHTMHVLCVAMAIAHFYEFCDNFSHNRPAQCIALEQIMFTFMSKKYI